MPLYTNKRPSLRHNGERIALGGTVEMSVLAAAALLALGAIEPAEVLGEPSDPIQPGDDDRTDGSSVEGAEAGAPASAPETDSITDVLQQTEGDATPPAGETSGTDAAIESAGGGTTSEGDAEKSEAPADTAAPKADAKAAKKKAK